MLRDFFSWILDLFIGKQLVRVDFVMLWLLMFSCWMTLVPYNNINHY